MKETTLFCKVGRAPAQPLGSFSGEGAEHSCNALQNAKTAELVRSGVDLDRVSFERKTVTHKD